MSVPHHVAVAKALPVWYLNGKEQYNVPDELKLLSLAEMMLIQRVAPFVPLRYTKNGVFGMYRHVRTFEQHIQGFVNALPRHQKDVTMLSMLKAVQAEIGNDATTHTLSYNVNKARVLVALKWLQLYNAEYNDIDIQMSALDWMEGEEETICKVASEPVCAGISMYVQRYLRKKTTVDVTKAASDSAVVTIHKLQGRTCLLVIDEVVQICKGRLRFVSACHRAMLNRPCSRWGFPTPTRRTLTNVEVTSMLQGDHMFPNTDILPYVSQYTAPNFSFY